MDLFQMSVQGGIIIILTIIIRSVWLNSLPKTAFIVMWEAAILRLLLPIKLPFDLSVTEALTDGLPRAVFTEGVVSQGGGSAVLSPSTAAASVSGPSVNISLIIWLIGAAVCTVYFVVTYIRCRGEFGTALPVRSEFVSEWLENHKLRRTVTVRQSGAISSPLTYGIINPVILLPKNIDTNNKQQLRIILMHEFTHIRRFDGLLKAASTAAVCVHWFNPLVWIMRELVSRDIELRCDESVLSELGIDSRAEYALALIELEEQRSGLLPIGSGFAKSAVEERITAIMKYKKKTIVSIILAIVLVCTATISVFAIDAYAETYMTAKKLVSTNPVDISEFTFLDMNEDGVCYLPISEAKNFAFNGTVIFTDDNGEPFYYTDQSNVFFIPHENTYVRKTFRNVSKRICEWGLIINGEIKEAINYLNGYTTNDIINNYEHCSFHELDENGEYMFYMSSCGNLLYFDSIEIDDNIEVVGNLSNGPLYYIMDGETYQIDIITGVSRKLSTDEDLDRTIIELDDEEVRNGTSEVYNQLLNAEGPTNTFELPLKKLDGLVMSCGIVGVIDDNSFKFLRAGDIVSVYVELDREEDEDTRLEIGCFRDGDRTQYYRVGYYKKKGIAEISFVIPVDGDYVFEINNHSAGELKIKAASIAVIDK